MYVLPTDLSLIKQVSKLEEVFFGSPKKYEGELVNSFDSLDLNNQAEGGSENLGAKNEETCLKKIQCEDEKTAIEDISIKNECEDGKFLIGNSKNPIKPRMPQESKWDLSTNNRKTLSKEHIKLSTGLLPPSNSSQGGETSSAPVNARVNQDKTVCQIAMLRATDQLSKALCASKQHLLTLHTYDDLEKSFSEWSLCKEAEGKNESSPSGVNHENRDWWPSANVVLTAANLQLQELRENALKKPGECEDVKYDLKSTLSDDSSYHQKKSIPKSQKRFNGKSGGKSQFNMTSKSHVSPASQNDSCWLWDESSKLYYIWDEMNSYYYLYNPDINCHFIWESGLNRYYKWDIASQKYRLWDCEANCYCDKSNVNLNDRNRLDGHSDTVFPRDSSDQSYISWFSMWNKQIRQMSLQVYQAEYLKNLLSQSGNP